MTPVNPGEAGIREGVFAGMWPARFPEGQGNDFAGWIVALGSGVNEFAIGDEVIGYLPGAAQADYVVSPAAILAPKPVDIPWEVAAPLSAVGVTAWAAVHAVDPQPRETVVVSAAAGGVGFLAAQLARLRGATVIGTAGARNADFPGPWTSSPYSTAPDWQTACAFSSREGSTPTSTPSGRATSTPSSPWAYDRSASAPSPTAVP